MPQRKIMIEITRTERMTVEVSAEQDWEVPEDLTGLFEMAERLKSDPEGLWMECKGDYDVETVSCEVTNFRIE